MSLMTRCAAAPLPPSFAENVPPDTDPVERLRLDHAAADTAAREASRRVADLRRALDHLEANPLDYPEVSYPKACDEARRSLAKAAAAATRANAAKVAAAEAYEAAKVQRAVQLEAELRTAADQALEGFAQKATASATDLLASLALVSEATKARDANREELKRASKPFTRDVPFLSLAFAFPQLVDKRPGLAGALGTAANVVVWSDPKEVAKREAEQKKREQDRQNERERAARYGHFGPEAQLAQTEKDRAALRDAYPGQGALAQVNLAKVDPEVRRYREAAGIRDERGE